MYNIRMGIFDFVKNKVVASRTLVVHIGSTQVLASIVSHEDGKPIIESLVSSDIAVLSSLSYSQFEREMQKALSGAISKISGTTRIIPDSAYVFLSSPWYASQVRTAKLSRDTQFIATKQMLDDMVGKELKAFEEEVIKAKSLTEDALGVIESKTVSVKLNGYLQENPIGKRASELDLSIFLAVAPISLSKKIEESIHRIYSHAKVTLCTFLTASFIAGREILPHKDSYILLDIGGEITDVSIMRDGSPVQSISFPIGKNLLLRRLSKHLGRSMQESATLCMLYMEDKIENKMKEACAKILNESKGEWLGAFQRTLMSMTSELSLPDTILLTVDSDIAPWFVELTSHEEFHQYSLSEKEFKVVQLKPELFHEKLSFKEGVSRNPFIMIEALSLLSLKK